MHAVVIALISWQRQNNTFNAATCDFFQWRWTAHKSFVHKKAPNDTEMFFPCHVKLTVNKNEPSVCFIASCLATNETFIWMHKKHEMMMTWNAPQNKIDKILYLAIHQVSWTRRCQELWTCKAHIGVSFFFIVFRCNMCQWTNVWGLIQCT